MHIYIDFYINSYIYIFIYMHSYLGLTRENITDLGSCCCGVVAM